MPNFIISENSPNIYASTSIWRYGRYVLWVRYTFYRFEMILNHIKHMHNIYAADTSLIPFSFPIDLSVCVSACVSKQYNEEFSYQLYQCLSATHWRKCVAGSLFLFLFDFWFFSIRYRYTNTNTQAASIRCACVYTYVYRHIFNKWTI